MRTDNSGVETDMRNFIEALLPAYKAGGNLLSSIEQADVHEYCFSAQLNEALRRYLNGTPARASFLQLTRSTKIKALFSILANGLGTGADITLQLETAYAEINSRIENAAKNSGTLRSAALISNLGSAVFFPVFAGVSTDIVKFAGTFSGGATGVQLPSLAIVLAAYIVLSNYLNVSRNSSPFPQRIAKTALYCCVGVILFVVSSEFAINFLGE